MLECCGQRLVMNRDTARALLPGTSGAPAGRESSVLLSPIQPLLCPKHTIFKLTTAFEMKFNEPRCPNSGHPFPHTLELVVPCSQTSI